MHAPRGGKPCFAPSAIFLPNQPKPPRRRGVWTPRLQHQSARGKPRGMKQITYGSDPMPVVDKVKGDLRIRARYREVAEMGGTHTLREAKGAYPLNSSGESETLTLDNTCLWQKNAEAFETWRGPTRKTLASSFALARRTGYNWALG